MDKERRVGTDELRLYIARCGRSYKYLADRCGISLPAFYNKMNRKVDFTCYEASVLKKELRINELAVFCRIFGFIE